MKTWLSRYTYWILWLVVTLALAGYYSYVTFKAEDKRPLLPGVTTHGHYQIEMECYVCHNNEPNENLFTSSGVTNESCLQCHGEALEEFSDSHPVRKFKNPENAIFLEHIQAMDCVSCHSEHNPKITEPMGVSLPADYCTHCHQVTLENLESHKNLEFNTCATAGCHNYHDNMALSPSYLLKNFGQPNVLENPITAFHKNLQETETKSTTDTDKHPNALTVADADHPATVTLDAKHLHDWSISAHSREGVNCSDCHQPEDQAWSNKVSQETCASCHDREVKGFQQGKHGMRSLHEKLSPMTPELARLPMHKAAAHKELDCQACHDTHQYDRHYAAYEACVKCHNDEHTNQYKDSKHYHLFQKELLNLAPKGSGVSCATCHMPHVKRGGEWIIDHDQSNNLRPNEKMTRTVCTSCHGLQFSMDAMADPSVIQKNFQHPSSQKHPGIDWAVDAAVERGDEDIILMKQFIQEQFEKQNDK